METVEAYVADFTDRSRVICRLVDAAIDTDACVGSDPVNREMVEQELCGLVRGYAAALIEDAIEATRAHFATPVPA